MVLMRCAALTRAARGQGSRVRDDQRERLARKPPIDGYRQHTHSYINYRRRHGGCADANGADQDEAGEVGARNPTSRIARVEQTEIGA